ncbi:DNA adenine methylase [Subtercola sp. Z020]|uniref:DNA adenine methylase n=1 Tax=Subtercola sp. Z020 TaxID=2080582 RepID=UPI00130DFC0D|nr:DNA adenine methylase [Subtercola sp. Z020]
MVLIQPKRTLGYSPLRYPGGKSSLTDFLLKVLDHNFEKPAKYVEPFAGGAGAAIALLLQGRVSSIVVNDLDPAIWSLWHSIVNDGERFRTLVRETEVTLDEWRTQREIYASKDVTDPLTLGFSAFFLNRTSRSGVMNAGVIGGQAQSGTYRIDARYNKPSLLHMMLKIAERKDSIEVRNADGLEIITEFADTPETLIYADPPYFDKGSYLYMNSFTAAQHEALASALNERAASKWILTYDNVPVIRDLYSARQQQVFSLYYSAHNPGIMNELMVFSDGLATDF